MVGCCRKSYIGPVEIASFCNRDFSRSNKHVVSAEYFYVLFLSAIAVIDFRHMGTYKNLAFLCLPSLLLSRATQITISMNIFVSVYTV